MNDKEIRAILISWLKASNSALRIYQEKAIGASVCDMMVVTDCLTGYEIKSDLDNYRRLPQQVKNYGRYFDKNYIVAGAQHCKTVGDRVPDNWGVIIIDAGAVRVERTARADREGRLPSRRDQLSILWKLELKNLLTKTNMPLFTYKSKEYIIEQIYSQVPNKIIHQHIVYELLHRDYSVFDAKDYTIKQDGFPEADSLLPVREIIDMLSETPAEQFGLTQWIALYTQAQELRENKTSRYQQRRAAVPHKIPCADIQASPGVPWINASIISDFVYYLRTGKESTYPSLSCVRYEAITGNWFIPDKKSYHNNSVERLEFTYGLPDYNALYIFEALLNLREIKLYDSDGRYSEAKTLAALEKQEKISALFQEWLWSDPDRCWEVEEAYNAMFAKYAPRQYDGSALTFPGLSQEVSLYPYQKDAVQCIVSNKNTLLAFDVGAGKTYIMIAAAMRLRQEGRSRKNMFVVPNNIVGQWELIFKKMYPAARLLVIEPNSFKPQMRQKLLRQARDGDYDGIIIAYSCFEMIPLSGKYILENMNKKLGEIRNAVNDLKFFSGTNGALSREADYVRKLAGELSKSMQAGVYEITFDQLEINTLFVDEAHNFKNIPLRSNLRRIAGVNVTGSQKCLEMLTKVRAVQEANQGGGVVFATGTPLCNSISDAYAMQMYLQYDELKASRLDRFDNWVKSFAKPERVWEIDVDTAKFRSKYRFSRFFNLPELSLMFSAFSVFYAITDTAALPQKDGYDDILVPRSPGLQQYMAQLCQRTEKIRAHGVDRSKDNMLKVSTDGRKAALDLRLVGMEQPYDEYTKLCQCVQNIMGIYRSVPGCAQIVFCDYSTPKGDKYNVYAELAQRLQEQGVPAKEIAFIHSYHAEARKVALYEKVNAGIIRVLIGSTFKLGIGANVQTRLKAIHHLDVPWRPADMVQREGRIMRYGNTNASVRIFRYICEGSFDAYSWQILENKQKFISQFLNGSAYQRTASDLEENVLDYAQVKALALAEPLMKELSEKENQLRRLQILSCQLDSAHLLQKSMLAEMESELAELNSKYRATCENAKYIAAVSSKQWAMARQSIKGLLTQYCLREQELFPQNTSFLGFNILLPSEQDTAKPHVLLERENIKYSVEMGASAGGNVRRIENFLKKLDALAISMQERMIQLKRETQDFKHSLQQDDPYCAQIKQIKSEIEQIRFKMRQEQPGSESRS